MSEGQDSLSQLWQKQKVEQADLLEVTKKWRKVRLKQRFYVLLDFLSLAIPFAIIWFKADKLDSFTTSMLIALAVVGVVMVVYITWLRRFSLGWSNSSTEQHIQQLQKQIQNNIKIANFSLQSVWLVVILSVLLYVCLYYFQVFPPEKLKDKIVFTVSFNAIVLPCIWVWAARRKSRFSRELAELDQLLHGKNSLS